MRGGGGGSGEEEEGREVVPAVASAVAFDGWPRESAPRLAASSVPSPSAALSFCSPFWRSRVIFSGWRRRTRGRESCKKIPRKSRFELDFRRPHDPRRAALSRFHFHHPQKVKERINRFFFCCERSDSGGENRLFAQGQPLLPDDDAGRGGDSTCLAQGADVDQAEERRRKRRRRRERKRPGAKKEALEQGRTRKSRRRKSLEVDEDGFTVLRVREGASRGLLRDDVGPAEEAEEVAWRLSLVGVCVWRRRGKRGKRGREGERSGSWAATAEGEEEASTSHAGLVSTPSEASMGFLFVSTMHRDHQTCH
jgi:hypothetical protein